MGQLAGIVRRYQQGVATLTGDVGVARDVAGDHGGAGGHRLE